MRKILLLLGCVAGLATTGAAPALAKDSVQVGALECVIEGSTNLIVTSKQDLSCTFKPVYPKLSEEKYVGVIREYGLDLGVTDKAYLQWIILAPTADSYAAGSLAGDYAGVSADAAVGIGAGANVLVGGSNSTFTLQPVSVEVQTGLNLAIGVANFNLRPAP